MTTSLLQKIVADADGRQIESVIDWSRRWTDPMVRWAWNNGTSVIPACKDKGIMSGERIFPDGTRETFVLQ